LNQDGVTGLFLSSSSPFPGTPSGNFSSLFSFFRPLFVSARERSGDPLPLHSFLLVKGSLPSSFPHPLSIYEARISLPLVLVFFFFSFIPPFPGEEHPGSKQFLSFFSSTRMLLSAGAFTPPLCFFSGRKAAESFPPPLSSFLVCFLKKLPFFFFSVMLQESAGARSSFSCGGKGEAGPFFFRSGG